MVDRKILVSVLLVAIIFSLSGYGIGQLSTTTLTSTTTIVSTITETKTMTQILNMSEGQPIPGFLRDKGRIIIQDVGNFEYVQFEVHPSSEMYGSEVTLRNVTFTYLDKGIIIGPVCHYFNIAFQDGSSEEIPGCSYPTTFESLIRFSDHNNPKAGLIILNLQIGQMVYILVKL